MHMKPLCFILLASLLCLSVKVQAQINFNCGTRPSEPSPNHPPVAARVSGPAAKGGNKPQFIRLKQPKTIPIVQEKEKNKLILYPNPATNIINIAFKDIQQVSITDVTGRLLLNRQLGGISNTQLNISSIGKGIFFVRVISKDGSSETKKLVVQ